MSQKVKETKHTVQDNGLETISRVMQVLFALVQILLVFRLAFKLLGANASNVFVNLIYSSTAPLVGLFEGIFTDVNLENNALAVFEPATVIAIIVTAAVSYIVLRMLAVKQDKQVEHVEVQKQAKAIPLGKVSETRTKEASETPVEQSNNHKLEKESQELEERNLRQEQILEHQRKTYGASYSENELDEHQRPALEDQVKMYSMSYNEPKINENLDLLDDEVQIYEMRRRQV